MTRFLTALLLLILCAAAFANDPADSIVAKPWRYFFSFRSAALFCNDCDMDGASVGLLSTVHGIRLNKTFNVGAGLGLTSASETLIAPLFGSVRLNMWGKKKNKVFIEMNYGGAFSFDNTDNEEYGSPHTVCKRYFQPSIGYTIIYNDLNIGILLGMQSLRMATRYTYPSWSWGWYGTGTPSTTEYGYQVSRLMVGISVGWRD